MATPVYPFNPYQDIVACRVSQTIATVNTKSEYVPRVAPFFSKDAVITKVGDSVPLVFGKDYVFAHPFDEFINDYKRNVFGSLVLLKPYTGSIKVDIDTIGTPFILNDVAFAKLVADILTKPREASWNDLVPESIPPTFPTPPHDHPIIQTYDYLEMTTMLRSLILATNNNTGGMSIVEQFLAHVNAELPSAHGVSKTDLGIEKIPNIPRAVNADFAGNSNDVIITMQTLKEAFRRFAAGTLNLG